MLVTDPAIGHSPGGTLGDGQAGQGSPARRFVTLLPRAYSFETAATFTPACPTTIPPSFVGHVANSAHVSAGTSVVRSADNDSYGSSGSESREGCGER